MEVQKSQKGADDIIMKRKIYQKLLDWETLPFHRKHYKSSKTRF